MQSSHLFGHSQASQHFLSTVHLDVVPHLHSSQHLQILSLQHAHPQQLQQFLQFLHL